MAYDLEYMIFFSPLSWFIQTQIFFTENWDVFFSTQLMQAVTTIETEVIFIF